MSENSTDFSITNEKKKRGKTYCSNCGNYGHVYKKCSEATTSIGIISYYIDNGKIMYNLIRRKYTLGYCEFIRGRYSLDCPETIALLLYQMSNNEIELINKYRDIDVLWNNLWRDKQNKSKNYKLEQETSKERFNVLLKRKKYNLDHFLSKAEKLWKEPEWGFPKGRRNIHENNLECAKREFMEETGYNDSMYDVNEKLGTFEELFHGTNGVQYRHIYYVAEIKTKPITYDEFIKNNYSNEIGDINYFTFNKALLTIRPYHKEKKRVLTEVNLLLECLLLKQKSSLEHAIV